MIYWIEDFFGSKDLMYKDLYILRWVLYCAQNIRKNKDIDHVELHRRSQLHLDFVFNMLTHFGYDYTKLINEYQEQKHFLVTDMRAYLLKSLKVLSAHPRNYNYWFILKTNTDVINYIEKHRPQDLTVIKKRI